MEEYAVREVSAAFYRALSTLDLGTMEEVWSHDGNVTCVHPGWELLCGWAEVRESWRRIFAAESPMRVEITDVQVQLLGVVAWVVCLEHITTAVGSRFLRSAAQATNIFLLQEGQWRMVHHHASPTTLRAVDVARLARN